MTDFKPLCAVTLKSGGLEEMLLREPHPLQHSAGLDFRLKAKSTFRVLKSTNLYSIVPRTVITPSTSFSIHTFAAESFKKMIAISLLIPCI